MGHGEPSPSGDSYSTVPALLTQGLSQKAIYLRMGTRFGKGWKGQGLGGAVERKERWESDVILFQLENILKLPIQQNVKHWVEAHGYGEGVWNTMSCF